MSPLQLMFRRHRKVTKLSDEGCEFLEKKLLLVCRLKPIRRISCLLKCITPANPILPGPIGFLDSRLCVEPLAAERLPAVCLGGSLDLAEYVSFCQGHLGRPPSGYATTSSTTPPKTWLSTNPRQRIADEHVYHAGATEAGVHEDHPRRLLTHLPYNRCFFAALDAP